MRTKVRAALDAIDLILAVNDRDAQDLTALLSALRGPDTDSYAIKASSTAPLRTIMFPKMQQSAMAGYWNMALPDTPVRIPEPKDSDWHFRAHIRDADEAVRATD